MYVRRKTINEVKGNQRLQKALALALYIKSKVGRNSTIHNYSTNKIRKLTGLSASTINKYIPIMKDVGFAHCEGKKKEHLVINNLASSQRKRNIDVSMMCYSTYKDVFNSLRSFIALIIQAKKDFIKRTIQKATNPRTYEEMRSAKKLVKRLVKQGILNSLYDKYREFGLSYKRIANEVGCCARTAIRVIQYAVQNKWVVKEKHCKQTYAPKINGRIAEGYTFCTKNNAYIVYSNTYSLSCAISQSLSSCNTLGNISV